MSETVKLWTSDRNGASTEGFWGDRWSWVRLLSFAGLSDALPQYCHNHGNVNLCGDDQ